MGRFVALVVAVALVAGCAGGNRESGTAADLEDRAALHVLGRVVDSEIVPISGATVHLQPGEIRATTDADGAFRLGPLDAGEFLLIAEHRGYAAAELPITIVDEAVRVTLVLEPIASDVPYHSSRIFTPYFQCVTSGRPVAFEWNTSCVGLLDFFTGMNISQDQFFFPLVIDAPGFAHLLLEMDWRVQTLGHDMALAVWDPRAVAQTSITTNEYYSQSSAPPLRGWLIPGEENFGAREHVVFYPTPNATARYEVVVSSYYTNSTTVPDFALFLEHRAMLIETLFFNRRGSPDFAALPDR